MAKIKVTIPARTIEIPAYEVEVDIPDIMPEPIEPPVVVEPPIVTPEPVDDVLDLDWFMSNGIDILDIPSRYKYVKSKGMIKPKSKSLIGNNIVLQFQDWESTPRQLFDLSECEEFAVVGITFACPNNRPILTEMPYSTLFGWTRNSVKKGKFAWINGPEVKDKDIMTFGLSNFCYSSDSDERIYLIGKNIYHNGYNFTQCKNPYKGNLWLILQNVNIHNPIIEEPQSHYYTPTRIKVRIRVSGGIAEIISGHTYNDIKTWVGFNNGNQRSILHFDRYVYDINEGRLLSPNKLLIAHEDELHAGDVTSDGIVVNKHIDESRRGNWVYTFDPTNNPEKIRVPSGEFDAFIVHKGNALFFYPIDHKTKFGDWWVTLSQGFGWTWYNEEFSGYIENYNGDGYHRNSSGSGITQGLTIRNSKFGKNCPASNDNKDMPEEVRRYIEYLEGL